MNFNTYKGSFVIAICISLFLLFLPMQTFAYEVYKDFSAEIFNSLSDEQIRDLESKGYTPGALAEQLEIGRGYDELSKIELVEEQVVYHKVIEYFPAGYQEPDEHNVSAMLFDEFERASSDEFYSEVIELTEEEFLKEIEEEDESVTLFSTTDEHRTSTSYKRMATIMYRINRDRYRVSNKVDWTKMPIHRKHDIIAIALNKNTSPLKGTEWAKQTWTSSSGTNPGSATYTTNSSKWERNASGYGLYFKLKQGFTDTGNTPVGRITMYMEYEAGPNVSNVTLVDGYGHYYHLEHPVNITPSFTIGAGGVGVSISGGYQSEYTRHRPETHVQLFR
ncbi:hypothetical protein [Halalkalibacter alkalisediminis]|uniref:Uncharacterized protein n=1 Tax=Halalkalibacter alkalisediminis TaxID=935616 RepID=A0ABV6NMB0_9BACI|nr:hypothetical protein [Halalkalibacter alkalisediminis]